MALKTEQLYLLATTQTISDKEVAYCGELVRHGIQIYSIGCENLNRLLDHLHAGNGMGWDELSIEIAETDAERAMVALLDDERTCSAVLLLHELEKLHKMALKHAPINK